MALDRGLVAAGHRSLVVAPAGSETAGALLATAPLPAHFTAAARRRAETVQRARIAAALEHFPINLIHCHGLDFAEHLPGTDVPTLVTLHLLAEFYPASALERPATWFNCVSAARCFPMPRTGAISGPRSCRVSAPLPGFWAPSIKKRRFLSAARCLLAPSLIAETGSLVAMEALTCGTPVVAPGSAFRPR